MACVLPPRQRRAPGLAPGPARPAPSLPPPPGRHREVSSVSSGPRALGRGGQREGGGRGTLSGSRSRRGVGGRDAGPGLPGPSSGKSAAWWNPSARRPGLGAAAVPPLGAPGPPALPFCTLTGDARVTHSLHEPPSPTDTVSGSSGNTWVWQVAVRALKKGACEGRVTFFAEWSGKPSLGLGQWNKGLNEVKDGAVQTSWGESLQAAEGVGGWGWAAGAKALRQEQVPSVP